MIVQIFAVRDAKTESFSQPYFAVTKGVGLRMFMDDVQSRESIMSKHPEDYALFNLGVYDDQTGCFESLPQPVQMALALDYKKE